MLQMHVNGCVSWKMAVFQETAGSIMQRIKHCNEQLVIKLKKG